MFPFSPRHDSLPRPQPWVSRDSVTDSTELIRPVSDSTGTDSKFSGDCSVPRRTQWVRLAGLDGPWSVEPCCFTSMMTRCKASCPPGDVGWHIMLGTNCQWLTNVEHGSSVALVSAETAVRLIIGRRKAQDVHLDFTQLLSSRRALAVSQDESVSVSATQWQKRLPRWAL